MKKRKKLKNSWLQRQMRPGVTIGRPIKDAPKHSNNYHVHALFVRLLQEGFAVDEYDLWHPRGGSVVASSRNEIAYTFMERDGIRSPRHDYLLWMDDDQQFPPDYDPYDAFKMLYEADKDIIGAPTVRKWPPYKPNIAMFCRGSMKAIGNFPKDEPFRVHQIGFGFVLVKRKVIEDMILSTDPPSPPFHNPLEYNPMINKVELRGEDYRFCIRALQLGFDIWCEPRIPLGHIGEAVFYMENFERGGYKEELFKTGEVIDICQDTNLYAELAEKLRKSRPQLKNGRENLSSVSRAVLKQKENGISPTSDSISGVQKS